MFLRWKARLRRAITEKLQAKLTDSAEHVLASRPTENPEAHQLYLKGRYFWNKRTTENLKKAIDYFEQAIGRIQPTHSRIPGSPMLMQFCLSMPPLLQRMMLEKRWLPPAKR